MLWWFRCIECVSSRWYPSVAGALRRRTVAVGACREEGVFVVHMVRHAPGACTTSAPNCRGD
eukprot:10938048-Alexandrium_andersonii.AAC.1